jgi:amino acid transporter
MVNEAKVFKYLTATTSIILLILTVALVSAIVINIFLYKNRKLQLRIVLAAILISLLNIFLYYRQTKEFVEGNYDLTAILVLAIPVLLILAATGINKDEKLVRSLDRLR